MKRGPHTGTPWGKSKQSKEEVRIKELQKKFKNRKIVRSIPKKDWPYPPESTPN